MKIFDKPRLDLSRTTRDCLAFEIAENNYLIIDIQILAECGDLKAFLLREIATTVEPI